MLQELLWLSTLAEKRFYVIMVTVDDGAVIE